MTYDVISDLLIRFCQMFSKFMCNAIECCLRIKSRLSSLEDRNSGTPKPQNARSEYPNEARLMPDLDTNYVSNDAGVLIHVVVQALKLIHMTKSNLLA